MNSIQKKLVYVVVILSVVFAMGACTEPDPIVPTERIVIKNIPREIYQSWNSAISFPYASEYLIGTNEKKPVFKVYLQLSDAMDEFASNPAEGEMALETAESEGLLKITGNTFTITIPLTTPLTEARYDGGNGITTHDLVSTAKWSNIALIICPDPVDTIFDIDAKMAIKGPTSSPDVVFDWKKMYTKNYMTSFVTDELGTTNYKQLYGKKDYKVDFGVVRRGAPYQTSPFPPGVKTPAGEEIYTFNQFVNRN